MIQGTGFLFRYAEARSWINLIESSFSKIAREFFRLIRVDSKQEVVVLQNYQGIFEINKGSAVFLWCCKMGEIAST